MNSNRQVSLWDLLTFMSVAGPLMPAYEVAKGAGLNSYLRAGFVAGGLGLGVLCVWFIRVSVFRLSQCLIGSADELESRTDLALKTIVVLLYVLTGGWVLVAIWLGDRFARTFVQW